MANNGDMEINLTTRNGEPTMKKTAKARTLRDVKADPRVVLVWNEGDYGWWADLASGYNRDGCSQLHGETVQELCDDLDAVEAGEPY
jgi:hypothetical protein